MNLDDLRSVQSDERRADSLQPLPEDFYRDVATYIEQLRTERERAAERADDPFGSDEVRQLTDEIETAEEVAEAIYERRVGKVVKQASLAAAGMSLDREGLTAEERALFADLVELIESHREDVLAAFAGERESESNDAASASDRAARRADDAVDSREKGSTDETRSTGEARSAEGRDGSRDDPEPPASATPDAAAVAENAPDVADDSGPELDVVEAMGGSESRDPDREETSTETDGGAVTDAPDPEKKGSPSNTDEPGLDRTTVRVTQDVGEILGVDERTYHLGEEDVVSLPEENAKPLLERDAARKIE